MAQLVAHVVSEDAAFKQQIGGLLRSGATPISILDDRAARDGAVPDVVVVDARGDSSSAMATVERLRGAAPAASIFTIAQQADPDVILHAMRAGANEFLTWPPEQEAFQSALRRTAARRESTQGARPGAQTLAFLGAKGGSGTTTIAVNCAVDVVRLSKRPTVIVDLKPSLGEVGLFLGVRAKYSLVDAIDNLHRMDREFLRELVVKHKSGLEILAGSDQFDRPGAADSGAMEELFRLLARQYEYVLVDVGNQISSVAVAALYMADQIFLVANPDVPSVRNAQRLIDRVRQLGACAERARLLLNRTSEPSPVPLKQIETAVGHPIHHTFPSDYKTVSKALNSGVPLTLSDNSELRSQFDGFARLIVDPTHAAPQGQPPRRGALGLDRIASLW